MEQPSAEFHFCVLLAAAQWDASGRDSRGGGKAAPGPQDRAFRLQFILSVVIRFKSLPTSNSNIKGCAFQRP